MAKKRTYLLLTQSQLARVDVLGGKTPRVEGAWTREPLRGESMATLADAALRLGPKKSGEVWVFSDAIWTGVVHLAADVARTLEGDELEQAIALEAETYSGVSAFESRLGKKSLPKDANGESRWWVSQVHESDWQEVDDAVQLLRGKLAGLGHASLAAFPEGLGEGGSRGERQPWRLNQAFGEATISINGVGDDLREVITFGDLKTQRTRSQLLQWCDDTAERDQAQAWVFDQPLPDGLHEGPCGLLSLSAEGVSAEGAREHDLAGESAVRAWAETMATTIEADDRGKDRMPVAVAIKPPMSNQSAALIACGLGVLVALGCFGLHQIGAAKLAELDTQIDTFNETKRALTTGSQAVQKFEKELKGKQDSLEHLEASNKSLAARLTKAAHTQQMQQTRWLELISALARANETNCWVKSIETQGEVVTVEGLAVANRDILAFAKKLEDYTLNQGWRLHPARTRVNDLSLIEFKVSLDASDELPSGAAPARRDDPLVVRTTLSRPTSSGSAPPILDSPLARSRSGETKR